MSSTESSPSVSRRSSLDSTMQDKIQVFVQNLRGDTTPLHIPTSTPIASLPTLLPSPTPTPTLTPITPHPTTLLTYHGRPLSLSPTSTLASNNIPPSSLLSLRAPLLGGMPPKKLRCGHKDCKDPAQRIVGDCGFCQGHFCGKHRLLESHACTGLEDCKKEERERNTEKLVSERTAVIKGV